MSARFVTLKLATSLDGKIATAAGESRWITGPQARQETHQLRSEHDAVLVGIETALADDPELTVRTPGYAGLQPARVVLDSRQRLGEGSRLALTAGDIPTYVIAATPPDARLTDLGVRVLQTTGARRPAPLDVVAILAGQGLHRLFIEGGGQVAASFLKAGLVDALEWFRAPIVIGAEGRPGIGDMGLDALSAVRRLKRIDVRQVGLDLWERYERI